ncbi:MAG: type I polyketide synthase, partial [Myxococcota bacterium]
MNDSAHRALAIVGVSAVLPDAPDARTFWQNVRDGRYSIADVDPSRWDPALYYDADPSVPDKTYSKLGGFVRDFPWDPMGWRLPIPPKVADSMDEAQKWAVACARAVLLDFGWPDRKLDLESTAVVLGNAMSGEQHYLTALRIHLPRFEKALAEAPSFEALPEDIRRAITGELQERFVDGIPGITEDTMPGELSNCMAGRIANLFDLHGPNFVCDAACAAALSAIDAAADGLIERQYDAVIVGGVDRNMGPEPYVKFSKIGALSATGTRPFADGADGFVMGEGAAFFLLKRLADAERDGDRIYAVLRGIGGASDGKGKGITAPNPKGQQLAIQRAWRRAGVPLEGVGLIEGHGTSTRVGDVVEVQSLNEIFGSVGLPPRSVPLGSVKSNIGHLKGAAGAAGLLKTVMALHEKVLPPSLGFAKPNPNIDFESTPFYVNTAAKPWDAPPDGVRRAGVSAFGFGGTNFHAVLEEYLPGRLTSRRTTVAVEGLAVAAVESALDVKPPPRGALVLGEPTVDALRARLERVLEDARKGEAPPPRPPAGADLRAPERLVIDYGDAAELASRGERAMKALAADQPNMWNAVRGQGIFRGRGAAPKIAFLYTGQGSQYANMLRELREREPIVRETFAEADRVMVSHLDRPLSDYIFPDPKDEAAVAQAEAELRRTEITQPAVLTVDTALTRLLAGYGIVPDLVMGHSLGEYGALVASGALPFEDALLAVSARGREMAHLSVDDVGRMAAVFAPLETVQEVVDATGGNVVIANVNSRTQAVIGGASDPVTRAIAAFEARDVRVVPLNVSHAFHTTIVAPASEPLRRTLEGLRLEAPEVPLVGNVHGELYPTGPGARERILDLLAEQVASPVQFVKGLETLYAEGVRVALEVGPKKALLGFATDVLGGHEDFVALFSNHPKVGDVASLNQALCG